NGNRRRKTFDRVHLRPLHLVQELPGIGGKRLDVPALAFGVNRVERERGLTRTRKPGDHSEGISRNFQADIFEVVLPRAANGDLGESHARSRYHYEPAAKGAPTGKRAAQRAENGQNNFTT